MSEADSTIHSVANPKAWIFSQFAAANMGTSQFAFHLALCQGILGPGPHMAVCPRNTFVYVPFSVAYITNLCGILGKCVGLS